MTLRQVSVGAALLFSGYAIAANGIGGPISGYVYDTVRGQLFPVNGRPGGAMLGAPVVLPRLRQASIAPEGYAVGVDVEGRVIVMSGLQGQQASVTQLLPANSSPDRVSLSGSGTATLYWRRQKVTQLISGLPGNASLGAPVDLSQVPGNITAIAADPTGSYLLVASSAQGLGGIYRANLNSGSTAVQLLVPAAAPVAIQFVNSGQDAVVLDQEANQLTFIQDVKGAASQHILASATDGLNAPSQLAAGGDGSYFLVANVGQSGLRMIRMQGKFAASVESIELPSVPAQLAALSTDLYLLSAGDGQTRPWYVLDASGTPTAYFVPGLQGSLPSPRRPGLK